MMLDVSKNFSASNIVTDTVLYTLTRLTLASDEGSNLHKIGSVLRLIGKLWMNDQIFTVCVKRNTLSQLCTIASNLAKVQT